nr:MAG TPA: hypothetical protein [Herelleviridae sp.]
MTTNNQGRASALWSLLVLRLVCTVRYNSTSLYVLYVEAIDHDQ